MTVPRFLLVAMFSLLGGLVSAEEREVITSVAEARAVDVQPGAPKVEVNLALQVIRVGVRMGGAFMTDGFDGIYVNLSAVRDEERRLQVGQRVRVRGVMGPGHFLPQVVAQSVEAGPVQPLPPARLVEEGDLSDPMLDCQWVALTGTITKVIRNVRPKEIGVQLQLYDRVVNFVMRDTPETSHRLEELVMADVQIQGAAATQINELGQMIGRYFHVPSLSFIKVLDYTPSEVTPINELLRGVGANRVVKIEGVVTDVQVGFACLRSGPGNIKVLSAQLTDFQVGDRVTAVGRVVLSKVLPSLLAREVKKIGSGPPPDPTPLKLKENQRSIGLHLQLSVINCVLRECRQVSDGLLLKCEAEGVSFEALVPGWKDPQQEELELGSELRLTGIMELMPESNYYLPQEAAFQLRLRLRSREDLRVLSTPPWWTMAHLASALGVIGLVALVLSAWVRTLHARVNQQTKVIRNQVQHKAVLEERQRLARELHDTLQQNMTGISMQLDHAKRHISDSEPDLTRETLTNAQAMLDQCRKETRESISRLRSSTSTRGSLAIQVEDTMRAECEISGIDCEIKTRGEPWPLDPFAARHALRITKEAFANARLHANPSKIKVLFDYDVENLTIVVKDNGSGFDPEGRPPEGHYGVIGMHERAERIESRLLINSTLGRGTMVSLKVPYSTAKAHAV